MNLAILSGRLDRDAEAKFTTANKLVVSLRLKTSRAFGDREFFSWHSIVAWGTLAEKSQTLPAGASVEVVGRIENRSYEKDGKKHYLTEIVADTITRTDAGDHVAASSAPPLPVQPARAEVSQDELPF